MAKDPAFLFYYQDFMNGTRFMSLEAKGAYIDALCYQADKGEITHEHMFIICQRQEALMMEVCDKFTQNAAGNYVNRRLQIEVEKRQAYAQSRRNNRLSGKKKRKKDMNNICKSYDEHMENENVNENIINNKEGVQNQNAQKMHESRISDVEEVEVDIWPTFDDFWDAYDHKVDRGRCEPKWDKLKQKEKEAIMAYIPDYLKATPDKEYRRHPSTFLNNRTWEGDLPVSKNRTNGRPNETSFERMLRNKVAKGNF